MRSNNALVGLALITMTLMGCTAVPREGDAASQLGDVSIDGYMGVTAGLDFDTGTARMPIDKVALETVEVDTRVLHAMWVLIDRCMVARGFPAIAPMVDWSIGSGIEDRSFGLWSVSLASTFGPERPSAGAKGGGLPVVDSLSLGTDYNAMMPSCMDSAKADMMPILAVLGDPLSIDYQIRTASYQATMSSREGKSAIARRIDCLEGQGIVVDLDSGGPSSDYFVNQETMIAIAVAEARCNVETGAIRELYDMMARYQAAHMAQQEALIVELSRQKEEIIRQLDAIIAGR